MQIVQSMEGAKQSGVWLNKMREELHQCVKKKLCCLSAAGGEDGQDSSSVYRELETRRAASSPPGACRGVPEQGSGAPGSAHIKLLLYKDGLNFNVCVVYMCDHKILIHSRVDLLSPCL